MRLSFAYGPFYGLLPFKRAFFPSHADAKDHGRAVLSVRDLKNGKEKADLQVVAMTDGDISDRRKRYSKDLFWKKAGKAELLRRERERPVAADDERVVLLAAGVVNGLEAEEVRPSAFGYYGVFCDTFFHIIRAHEAGRPR